MIDDGLIRFVACVAIACACCCTSSTTTLAAFNAVESHDNSTTKYSKKYVNAVMVFDCTVLVRRFYFKTIV